MTVCISERGAELCSVRLGGREYIWQGDERFWGWHSPVLFPVCGRLLHDRYRFGGKTYAMHMHGFAREKVFSAKQTSSRKAVFSLGEDEDTLSQYPFPFHLAVSYVLSNRRLTVRYTVRNTGNGPMFWNIGVHTAFYTQDGEWSVGFAKAQNLSVRELIPPGFLGGKKIEISENAHTLPVTPALFSGDSLLFENLRPASVELKRNDRTVVSAEFSDFPYFVLWKKEGAPFFCMEPWNGLPDRADTDGELSHKEGVCELLPGKEQSLSFSLQFFGAED